MKPEEYWTSPEYLDAETTLKSEGWGFIDETPVLRTFCKRVKFPQAITPLYDDAENGILITLIASKSGRFKVETSNGVPPILSDRTANTLKLSLYWMPSLDEAFAGVSELIRIWNISQSTAAR